LLVEVKSGDGMKFEDHLKEFLDNSIDDEEARQLAITAVASSIRQLKLGVAERLWHARQLGTEDVTASAVALGTARSIKRRFDVAMCEYQRLIGAPSEVAELHVIPGGRLDRSDASSAPEGGA
jgi:hypothetical protein